MKKQITKISVHQTSKVLTVVHFVVVALFVLPWAFYLLFSGLKQEAFGLFISLFFYLIFLYVGFALLSLLYNLVASTFGGIEFHMSESNDEKKL